MGEEKQSCSEGSCPVHCEVSTWAEWSACDKTCGTGGQTRTRSVTTHADHGGYVCPNLNEARDCNTDACPVPTTEPTKSPTQAGCLDRVPGANHPQCELFKTNQIYCQNVATANCIWVQGPTMAPTPLPNDHVCEDSCMGGLLVNDGVCHEGEGMPCARGTDCCDCHGRTCASEAPTPFDPLTRVEKDGRTGKCEPTVTWYKEQNGLDVQGCKDLCAAESRCKMVEWNTDLRCELSEMIRDPQSVVPSHDRECWKKAGTYYPTGYPTTAYPTGYPTSRFPTAFPTVFPTAFPSAFPTAADPPTVPPTLSPTTPSST